MIYSWIYIWDDGDIRLFDSIHLTFEMIFILSALILAAILVFLFNRVFPQSIAYRVKLGIRGVTK